jgi:hypothetical protein
MLSDCWAIAGMASPTARIEVIKNGCNLISLLPSISADIFPTLLGRTCVRHFFGPTRPPVASAGPGSLYQGPSVKGFSRSTFFPSARASACFPRRSP